MKRGKKFVIPSFLIKLYEILEVFVIINNINRMKVSKTLSNGMKMGKVLLLKKLIPLLKEFSLYFLNINILRHLSDN